MAVPEIAGLKHVGEGASLASGCTTYRFEDATGRLVDVTLLPNACQGDSVRFAAEAELLAEVSHHPNLASVVDAGLTEEGIPYVATEALIGPTLAELGTLGTEQGLALGVQLAAALDAAQRLGVAHGGIAPELVAINADGAPVLHGLGLSEMAAGGLGDARADTGALKALLLAAMVGVPASAAAAISSAETVRGLVHTLQQAQAALGVPVTSMNSPADRSVWSQTAPAAAQVAPYEPLGELADIIEAPVAREVPLPVKVGASLLGALLLAGSMAYALSGNDESDLVNLAPTTVVSPAPQPQVVEPSPAPEVVEPSPAPEVVYPPVLSTDS